MSYLDRRSFLLGAAGITGAGLFAAACGNDNTNGASGSVPTSSAAGAVGTVAFLVPSFPDGFRGPSHIVHGAEQRIAYAMHDGNDVMRDNAPEFINLVVSLDGTPVGGGPIARHDEGVITPYYPIRFTPLGPGLYTVTATDQPEAPPHEFLVVNRADSTIPRVGDQLLAVDTATFDDQRGVEPLCTRFEPCPFHETNLTDALGAADKPIVLSIATPGFCQTDICGPVIDLLIDVAAERDDLHVIHAEVYVDPQTDFNAAGGLPETVDVVNAYGLPFEPVLFVVSADRTILARLDAIYDRAELAAAVALA